MISQLLFNCGSTGSFSNELTLHRLPSSCTLQTAAFVDATDSRYGFSSKDLRKLGGSELSRLGDLMSMDHGAFMSANVMHLKC